MEYCNFSYNEARDLPVEYRKWFIERKKKELDRKKEAQEKAARKRTVTPSAPPPRPKK